ncbi:MAG: YlbF family regulator [Bacillales bacterium]|nr:YlbF family regulator [Bacillales bacterium]
MLAATLETIEIIEEAEKLAEMIVQSDIAEQYRKCYDRLYKTPATKEKINRFSRLKERYEEVQRFGRFHPDYADVMKNIREAKREMDLDENVAIFRKAENALQQLLDEVSLLIAHSVSPHIKVPVGNPFFEKSSGCGCGSGGACGCSA